MTQERRSGFSFEGYKIVKSIFDIESFSPIDNEISIELDLKGRNIKKNRIFELNMLVKIKDNNESLKIQLLVNSYFKYSDEFDKLETYFNINAPAILFPYVRSYISTISCLSGMREPIIIPTLNLMNEAEKLKNNTTEIL